MSTSLEHLGEKNFPSTLVGGNEAGCWMEGFCPHVAVRYQKRTQHAGQMLVRNPTPQKHCPTMLWDEDGAIYYYFAVLVSRTQYEFPTLGFLFIQFFSFVSLYVVVAHFCDFVFVQIQISISILSHHCLSPFKMFSTLTTLIVVATCAIGTSAGAVAAVRDTQLVTYPHIIERAAPVKLGSINVATSLQNQTLFSG